MIQGRRLPDVTMGEPPAAWEAWTRRQPGDYMKVTQQDGAVRWWICDPMGRAGRIGGQRIELQESTIGAGVIPVLQPPPVHSWRITEHDDGTITVEPSIMDPGGWHGYLERGVWRTPYEVLDHPQT